MMHGLVDLHKLSIVYYHNHYCIVEGIKFHCSLINMPHIIVFPAIAIAYVPRCDEQIAYT